jgi:serine/threonine-protein kinase
VSDDNGSSAHSYEVLGKLADGATTEIFLARAMGVGAVERFVVLKRLKRAVIGKSDLVHVFLDEARLAAQLQHPNIAQVFEVGKLGGSFFFAMEFVNGETLQSLMQHARTKKIQIPVRAVLTIGSAIAAGLHHAHERRGTDAQPLGIVHGEVSPTNTIVSQEGIVKLVDFGVAKAGERTGQVSAYSSPEQCRGEALDRRSDLFALGVVLWELLTLDPLYQRWNEDQIKVAITIEEPTPPSAKRYDVPPELDALVLKLLAKNPADRFEDADELLAAIEGLAQKLSILLSTADLSRMMRLWFGTKSEPTVDPAAADPIQPLVVASEAIPAVITVPSHTALDDQLDTVRSAAALITARATARSGNTGRHDKPPTVPPELAHNPNDSFEQIRDRILERARAKKETNRNQLAASGAPAAEQNHLASGAMSATGETPVEPAAAAASLAATVTAAAARPDEQDRHTRTTALPPIGHPSRHTRTTAQAPLSLIEEQVRLAGAAEPAELASNGSNGAHAPTEAIPQKVIIEPRPRTASGQIARDEIKAASDARREAPSAPANAADARVAKVEVSEGAKTVADPPATKDAPAKSATGAAAPANVAAKDAGNRSTNGVAKTKANNDERNTTTGRVARHDSKAAARKRDDVDNTERVARRAHPRATTEPTGGTGVGWVLPVVGLVGVMIVLLVAMRLRGDKTSSEASRGDSTKHATLGTSPGGRTPAVGGAPAGTSPTGAAVEASGGAPAGASGAGDTSAQGTPGNTATPSAGLAGTTATLPGGGASGGASPGASPGGAPDGAPAGGAPAGGTSAGAPAGGASAAGASAGGASQGRSPGTTPGGSPSGAPAGGAPAGGTKDPTAGKKDPGVKKPVVRRDPEEEEDDPEEKDPEPKTIAQWFAAGEFTKTNIACANEVVFTAEKLQMCATAACRTKNITLAKRWVNAIAKAVRPDMIAKCKTLGLDVEAVLPAPGKPTPPAASPPPASPPPASPPANP